MRNLHKLFYKDYYAHEGEIRENKVILKCNKNVNEKLIDSQLKIIPNEACSNNHSFDLLVQYPGLVSGVGISHEAGVEGEFKLGMHFDYTYGMPVIYGSSVKGVLRSAFPEKKEKEKIKKAKIKYIKQILGSEFIDIDVEALRDWIFEGTEQVQVRDNAGNEKCIKRNISIYDRDIFFDAIVKKAYKKQGKDGKIVYRFLEQDSITPHVKQGMSYQKSMLKNPIPISFLKIASGATIEFRFDLKDSKMSDKLIVTADIKKKLFKQILEDLGIGAKTNVGYGQFLPVG